MRLSDFILLSKDEKRVIVLHEGILVAKRMNYDCLVFLFQLDLFYVEAYCNVETKDVKEYRAFEETALLTPYLESIPIDHLFK